MARIVVIRTYHGSEIIDGAVVVQDDDETIVVYGEDKVLRETVKKMVDTGILIDGEPYKDSSFIDGILIKFNRKPYIWSVEMNEHD